MNELIRRTASGEAAAAGALYEANRGLIQKIAYGYREMCETDIAVTVDDLAQAGYFAVTEAARTWKEAEGSWSGWLVLHLRSEFNRALGRRNGRFLRPERGAASLDAPLSDEEADGDSMLDLMADDALPDSDESIIEEEIVRGVRAAVARIQNDRQRYIITETELKGRPYRDLAEELGISIETVRGDHNRAFKALRRDWELIALKNAHCIDPMAYYRYKSARSFQVDWTSTAEGAALWGVYGGELYREA